MSGVRVDKWLWATRVFKTRSIAMQACKAGRVGVNGAPAKPSRMVDAGDKVSVRKPPITYTFQVIEPISQRVGAAKVADAMRNITPAEELEYLNIMRAGRNAVRDRGTGRPTKKDRREIEDYMLTPEFSGDELNFDDLDFDENDFDWSDEDK